jgi:hypothetical protein
MEKFLKVFGCAGLLAGVIFITKKFQSDMCRTPTTTNWVPDIKDAAEHLAEKDESAEASSDPFAGDEKKEKLQEIRDALGALLDSREDNCVPENINYVEDLENDEQVFTIGDKKGELVPFSDEYKVIITSAHEKSLKDENFTLRLFGSTYGLGTKGQESEDGSKVFTKDAIAKLKNKLEK